MRKNLEIALSWLYDFASTTRFFLVSLILFVFQASWLAFSALYPLPFDEYVHVGAIQLYATQWSPFITEQPEAAGILGDITREPSYIYYYLMSFPYRFFDLFIDSEMALIIIARLINVAFVAGALILFRKLLLEWKLSDRTANIAILAFVMTPIVPFIAAHVNYDNLMLLGTPLLLLAATRIIQNRGNLVVRLMIFSLLVMLIVLVKRSFLPLAIITVVYVLAVLIKRSGRNIAIDLRDSWRNTAKGAAFFLLVGGLIITSGLFIERYGVNFVRYGSVWPHCHIVQSEEVCKNWGPWRRDFIDIQWTKPSEPPYGNIFSYGQHWVSWMMEGYYVLFSHHSDARPKLGDPYGKIAGRGYLFLPKFIGTVALIGGLIFVAVNIKKIWSNPALRFAFVISFGFIVLQFLYNYRGYLTKWRPVAIQARYTYPILIPMFGLMIQSASWKIRGKYIKSVLLVFFIALYVWGGGITGWVVRSPDTWKWQNQTVIEVNRAASSVLRYIIVD